MLTRVHFYTNTIETLDVCTSFSASESDVRRPATEGARADTLWPLLKREGAMYRALRLPRISSAAAQLLREFDRHGLLGDTFMVVGTNAMAAYEIEARSRFATAAGVDSTLDFRKTRAKPVEEAEGPEAG